MWNTPCGNRILQDSEANAFRQTVLELVDVIRAEAEFGESLGYGISIFDDLEWQQKLLMLLHVSQPLLEASCPEPPSSALRDGAVGAVFAQMLTGVQTEIDMQQMSVESHDNDTARRMEIVQALNEVEEEQSWPDPECVVLDEWELAVSALQVRVLPDEDWKFAEMTLDLAPDKAGELRRLLGIDRDYACDIPPDTDERKPASVWADLIEFLTGERPDENRFS